MKLIEVNGVRLAYREWGDPAGPPVLLLHGTGSRASTWDGFAAGPAAAGHRVIAADLRGHGASGRSRDYSLDALRDDVLGLLVALDLRDAVVIGHSVGAYAAMAAAAHSPGRIARLVLEDLAAPPRALAPMHRSPLRTLGDAAGILWSRRDYDLRAMTAIFRRLARVDADWWARLPEVRQPALVLSGGPASCIPPGRLAEVAAALPDARLVTIPVGHRVHSLAPDEFAAAVMAFLTPAVSGAGQAAPER